jgi:hypothetical protein
MTQSRGTVHKPTSIIQILLGISIDGMNFFMVLDNFLTTKKYFYEKSIVSDCRYTRYWLADRLFCLQCRGPNTYPAHFSLGFNHSGSYATSIGKLISGAILNQCLDSLKGSVPNGYGALFYFS